VRPRVFLVTALRQAHSHVRPQPVIASTLAAPPPPPPAAAPPASPRMLGSKAADVAEPCECVHRLLHATKAHVGFEGARLLHSALKWRPLYS
jgi:hypothetical protein